MYHWTVEGQEPPPTEPPPESFTCYASTDCHGHVVSGSSRNGDCCIGTGNGLSYLDSDVCSNCYCKLPVCLCAKVCTFIQVVGQVHIHMYVGWSLHSAYVGRKAWICAIHGLPCAKHGSALCASHPWIDPRLCNPRIVHAWWEGGVIACHLAGTRNGGV